jgi:hypothetical protein
VPEYEFSLVFEAKEASLKAQNVISSIGADGNRMNVLAVLCVSPKTLFAHKRVPTVAFVTCV